MIKFYYFCLKMIWYNYWQQNIQKMKDSSKSKQKNAGLKHQAWNGSQMNMKMSIQGDPMKLQLSTPTKIFPPLNLCREKHFSSQNKTNGPYFVSSNLLSLTDLSPSVRSRMAVWLMEETAKRFLERQTCALAITYMDLYWMKKGLTNLESVQELGLACLKLACKLNESFCQKIPICQQHFSHTKINAFQLQLYARTGFKLNPPTYVSYAQAIVLNWPNFISNLAAYQSLSLFSPIFCKDEAQIKCLNEVNYFFQLLQVAITVVEMMDYDLEDLVFNSFFVYLKSHQISLGNEKMISDAELLELLKNFVKYISKEEFHLVKEALFDLQIQEQLTLIDRILQNLKEDPFPNSDAIEEFKMQNSPMKLAEKITRIQIWKPYYLKAMRQASKEVRRYHQRFQL